MAKEYYGKMFAAIHRNRKLLNSKGRFINWLEEEAGADSDTAEKVYDSFTVSTKTARAADAAAVYGIDSTPQFVVAGKYILNLSISGPMFGFSPLCPLFWKKNDNLFNFQWHLGKFHLLAPAETPWPPFWNFPIKGLRAGMPFLPTASPAPRIFFRRVI